MRTFFSQVQGHISYSGGYRNHRKDIRAVTTPVTAPMVKEPLNIPRKMPTDLKKAAASKA